MGRHWIPGLSLLALLVMGWDGAAAGSWCVSRCPDASLVTNVRAAIEAACPCASATDPAEYKTCAKAVLRDQVATLGPEAFPDTCQTAVKRALRRTTCGRPDAVLCRKTTQRGESCRVKQAANCSTPFPATLTSCSDACGCILAAASKSSVGCDFFATSMDVYEHGDCFAVHVVNTSTTRAHLSAVYDSATLSVPSFTRIPSGVGTATTLSPYDAVAGLAPGEAAVMFLGGSSGASPHCPVASAVPVSSAAGTGIFNAFEIMSDAPVVAYQVNPWGLATSTTGSSLLLPTSTWDTDYVAVSAFAERTEAPPGSGTPRRTSFGPSLNIIAREDDTVATIVPNATVGGGGGVPAGGVGRPVVITLQKGQHAQITQALELTGSRISATRPIGLMAGHPCMNVPINQASFCDHGEQMIPPLHALGHRYVAVTYRSRAASEVSTVWRVVGAVDGTELTYSRQVGGPTTLDEGEVVQFSAGGAFVVSSQDAAHPFALFEYMTGSGAVNRAGIGDPEIEVVVPPEQFLDHYLFFTDPNFPETNLVVVRQRADDGTYHDVTLDCAGTLTGWQPVDPNFQFTRVDLTTGNFTGVGACSSGVREMHSDVPFGLSVWGWGSLLSTPFTRNVSYGYPAGMGVAPINQLDF